MCFGGFSGGGKGGGPRRVKYLFARGHVRPFLVYKTNAFCLSYLGHFLYRILFSIMEIVGRIMMIIIK